MGTVQRSLIAFFIAAGIIESERNLGDNAMAATNKPSQNNPKPNNQIRDNGGKAIVKGNIFSVRKPANFNPSSRVSPQPLPPAKPPQQ